jgi:hypothetical protein
MTAGAQSWPHRHMWAECLEKTWEPRPLTNLQASMACYHSIIHISISKCSRERKGSGSETHYMGWRGLYLRFRKCEACSATWNLGTNSAFALGPRKTTENLGRVNQVQVQVTLRRTVSQSVSLGIEHPPGAHDQIFIASKSKSKSCCDSRSVSQ